MVTKRFGPNLWHRPALGGSHKEPRELSTMPGTQRASWSTPAIFSGDCRDKSSKNEVGKGSLSEALIWKQKDQSQTMIGAVGGSALNRRNNK